MNKNITKKNEEFSIEDFIENNDILKKYSRYNMIKSFIVKEFLNYKDDLGKLNSEERKKFLNKTVNYLKLEINKKFFTNIAEYLCVQCNRKHKTTSSYQKCPKCNTDFYLKDLQNIKDLENSLLKELYQYSFYFLESEKQTEYLLYDGIKTNVMEKTGNSSLKDFIYIMCLEKEINIDFLKTIYRSSTSAVENILFRFFRENILTKAIWDKNFRPNAELIFEEENKKFFNCYFPNKYMKKREKKELLSLNIEKECPNIHHLISNLTGYRKDCFDYMIHYLSSILQQPEVRSEKAVNIFGEEASGKGTFFSTILKPLYKYVSIIKMKELESPYTDHYSKALILFIDEAKPNKDLEDELKSIITAPSIDINPKYGKRRTEENYMNIIIASNHNLSLTMGERRMVCFKARALSKIKKEREEIGKKLNEEIPNELNIFAEYLYNFKFNRLLINEGIDNIEKQDLMASTMTIEKQFVNEFNNFNTFLDFSRTYVELKNSSNILDAQSKNTKSIDGITYLNINYILEMYNNFRKSQNSKYSNVSLNKFSWIYDELEISRDKDKKECIRTTIDGHKTYAIKFSLIRKMFTNIDINERIIDYISEYNYLKVEDYNKIDDNLEKVEQTISKLIKNGVIYQPKKGIFHLTGGLS